MNEKFVPYNSPFNFTEEEMIQKSREFLSLMKSRRTLRMFSEKEVPMEVIRNCIKVAGLAPSGANMQPWHFVVVTNKEIKRKIRLAAEKEEKEFYENRAPEDWLNALEPFGTDSNKPFLEKAPVLIAVFEKKFDYDEKGEKIKHYYTKESVGLAAGFLITALHLSGLVSLTHTPSPMNFLNEILNRPSNEKPFLLLVTGFPSKDAVVPNISKKSLEEIASFL
ncbi:MAG: nitroreductase family protein [Ignavibacteria bacterium]|nr:MAG: nitroreductase family protein [Ignavibacteria bacterium]